MTRSTDNSSGRAAGLMRVVCVALPCAMTACMSSPDKVSPGVSQVAEAAPIEGAVNPPAAPGDSEADAHAASESATSAPIMTEIAVPPPPPIDPGADALAAQILSAVQSHAATIEVMLPVDRSRGGGAEMTELQARLSEALDRAARGALRFTPSSEDPARARMAGAAYMVVASGFDQWELYFEVRTLSGALLWTNGHPIRMLRSPRPGQPQFTAWPAVPSDGR